MLSLNFFLNFIGSLVYTRPLFTPDKFWLSTPRMHSNCIDTDDVSNASRAGLTLFFSVGFQLKM